MSKEAVRIPDPKERTTLKLVFPKETVEPLVYRAKDWSNEVGLLLLHLMKMPPRARLSRNLKVLLDLVTRSEVRHITREGVTELEYALLLEAQTQDMATKVAVHDLLNIRERMEARDMFMAMFTEQERRRKNEE
jgi:hypothetical protein